MKETLEKVHVFLKKKTLTKGGSIFYKNAKGKFPNFAFRFAKTLVSDFKSAFNGQSLCLNINNNIVGKVCI